MYVVNQIQMLQLLLLLQKVAFIQSLMREEDGVDLNLVLAGLIYSIPKKYEKNRIF
jgi:hypothetical protein